MFLERFRDIALLTSSSSSWPLGSIAAAWITFGTRNIESTWSWRLPSLFQMVPSVIQLCTIWFLPESPRWLISNDRGTEALSALSKLHGEGEETDLVKLEYEEICLAINMEKSWLPNVQNVAHLLTALANGATTWKSMVSTPGNRYRVSLVLCMGLFSQWSGNGLISYCKQISTMASSSHLTLLDLSRIMESVGITDKFTQSLVNGILQIWGFILGLTSAFFVDKIGRRPLFRISTIGMLITFIAWTIASANFAQTESKAAGMAVMAFIFIFTLFFGIAFTPLPVAYSVEILPYSIRAKGMATYVFSTKAAVFVNQYGE